MQTHVAITKSPRGAPARVSRADDRYLVHMRMRAIFERQESKTFVFCLDVEMPKGCLCFIQTPVKYNEALPPVMVISDTMWGADSPQPLTLTMKNTTNERQEWTFDDPIASLYFIDSFPVSVRDRTQPACAQ